MAQCKSSLDDVSQAVASLVLSSATQESDGATEKSLALALRDLYSGHLSVEAPGRVDATVAAVLPALCDDSVAGRLRWDIIFPEPSSEVPEIALQGDVKNRRTFDTDVRSLELAVDFFANRCARMLGVELDLAGHGHEGASDGVYVGVLGEAAQLIQALRSLLTYGFRGERLRLSDRTLAAMVYACERVITSTGGSQSGSGGAAMGGRGGRDVEESSDDSLPIDALKVIRAEANLAAEGLLNLLPSFGKRTPSLSALIVRTWKTAPERDSIHMHLVAALKGENKLHDSDDPLARLALESSVFVVRSLVSRLRAESSSHLDVVLPLVLAEVLPVVGDISQRRRVCAVGIVSQCLQHCSKANLDGHAGAIVAALTESLIQGDHETALETFPALVLAMKLLHPSQSIAQDPSAVWTEALNEVLGTFSRFVNDSGDNADQYLVAAAAIASSVPAMAEVRLVLHLSGVLASFETLMRKAGSLVARTGAGSLQVYKSSCEALVSVLRFTWPRIPAHTGAIVRCCFASVLSARTLASHDVDAMGVIIGSTAEVLEMTAECGQRAAFLELLDDLRPTFSKYGSLEFALQLDTAVRERLSARRGLQQQETKSSAQFVGSTVGMFFPEAAWSGQDRPSRNT